MACAIHHGGGVGTYKTFSVIQRHAIPQLKNGRTVISSIRGFDNIRVIEAVLEIEIPESANIIFVDLETTEGIEKMRRWWEWVPVGAYIIIDEAQLIYPKSKRITTYDYPSRVGLTSSQAAEADERPDGFLQAFTMQRHYNWDIAVITPNIKMLVPEIREVSQVAYEHKYMGNLVPWAKHGWREIQHSPLEMGKASKHPPVRYTADQRIYKVYKSTKTGKHALAGAERSIFQNQKVISVFMFIILCVSIFLYLLFGHILPRGDRKSVVESPVSNAQVSSNTDASNVPVRNVDPVDSVSPGLDKSVPVETTHMHSQVISIVGKMFDEYIIEFGLPPNAVQYSTGYLYRNGVQFNIVNDCLIEMSVNEVNYNVRCTLHRREFDVPKDNPQPSIEVKPFGAITGA